MHAATDPNSPANVYRAYIDAEARRDHDTMAALVDPELTVSHNGRPLLASGEDDAKATAALLACYPDYRRSLDDVFESGDVVVATWRMVGQARSDLRDRLGDLDLRGCSIVRVGDGRIVAAALYGDSLESTIALTLAAVGES